MIKDLKIAFKKKVKSLFTTSPFFIPLIPVLIIVLLYTFTHYVTVTKGEMGGEIKFNHWDVYYKKTKIFRDRERQKPNISDLEQRLLRRPMKKETKSKKIKIKYGVAVSTDLENKLPEYLRNVTVVKPFESLTHETYQTPAADSLLLKLSVKPAQQIKKIYLEIEQKKKVFIFGNSLEKNCYLRKKGCGFDIDRKVKQYQNKLEFPNKQIDTSNFPVDFMSVQ